MFTLKLYDTPLLTFTVDYDTLRGELTPRIHWVTGQTELLPCILIREHCDPRALMYWLNTRRPPRNREYASELYKQAGLAEDDLNGFLTVTKGLSVEDAYWTPGIHDTTRFNDVNLFDHSMSSTLSLVAYTGRSEYPSGTVSGLSSEWSPGIHDTTRFNDVNLFDHSMSSTLSLVAYTGRSEYPSGTVSGLSSEWSTGGTFPKAWRRVEGKLKLYKSYAFQEQVNTVYAEFYATVSGLSSEWSTGGTFPKAWRRVEGKLKLYKSYAFQEQVNTVYAEFYASQILDALGYSHVPYTLHKWKGKLAAVSDLFTSKEVAYVPYDEVHREMHPYAVLSAMLKAGEPLQVVEQARRMYIADILMQNLDRHTNNFGYLRGNSTGRLVGFAPLFDHNLSLYTATLDKPTKDTTGEDLLNRRSVKNFPMRARILVEALLTPDDHRALRKVLNLRLKSSKSYPGSAEYRRMAETATRKLAAAMLRVPVNRPSDVYRRLLEY